MGGVVSEIGDIGQGIISGVDEGLTQLDDAIPQEAKIAAAIYLASQGLPVGAEGAALSANAAVAADNAYLAAQALTPAQAAIANAAAAERALTATDLAMGGGGGGVSAVTPAVTPAVTGAPVAEALTPLSPVVPAITATSTTPLSGVAPVTAEGAAAGGLGSTQTGLLGTLGNLSTAQQLGLGAAALGVTGALSGNQPTSSTATTSIDPDIKAAFLRNLGEARETAAGLGQRQFAPFPEYNLGMVQKYMNPYENQVVQNTLADIERARQGQISAEGARATAAGAFGGTRQAVTRSLVDEAALRNAGNLSAQLRQAGFAQAQNLGLSQEELRRQYEQQRLDAQRNLGLERLNVAQGALSLQPARIGESTSTPIYRNPSASAFGGALGGAQLGSLIGGKEFGSEYAGYGAGLGGLLGFLG